MLLTAARAVRRRPVSVLLIAVLAVVVLTSVLPASASESSGAAAWGLNNDGQLGNDTTTTEKEAVAVKVLTEASAVAGGELHSLALLKSGKVMAWGDNVDGQLGNGTTTTEKEPVEVKGITEAVAIAAGADHSLALLKSGKVMAWGLNTDGQLGNGTTTTEKEPVEVKGISEAAAVAGGEFHSLALLKGGKVMAWGDNNDGQLGNGTTTTEKEPVEVKGITEAVGVAAGHNHSLAVLKSGKVMAWGDNNDGQLGNGTTTTEKEPVEVKALTEATAVAGGGFHSLALLGSGKVKAWGENNDGQLGNGTTTDEKEAVEVKGLSGAVGGISAGANFSLASYATKPANTALPAVSGEAKDEKTLTASTGTWTGSPTITYSYQWESCNTAGESCSSISGATASSYTIAHEQVGHTIRVKVTAKNSAGEASATSAQTATVAASAPANTALPAVSGEAKDEKTLTASTGSWSGTPTITYTYLWQRCNPSGAECANISGATASTYTVAHEDAGHTLKVAVTAKNSAGEATASSATVTVASAPVNFALPTISGTAQDGHTLTAGTGTWGGSEPISYSYQWQLCNEAGAECQLIAGATATTYPLKSQTPGHTLRVTVSATNALGSAQATSAASAVVSGASGESLCTDTWMGPTEGNWRTASDWSAGNTPTSGDVACVGAGKTVDVTEGANVAGAIEAQGSLVVSGGSLELIGSLVVGTSTASDLSISGGALEVPSQLEVSTLTLASGTLSLGGVLDVGSSLSVSGGGSGSNAVVSGGGK
ncbi:MAG: hypothetical protein ABSB69_17275, partial [Solirubrobacteraceae bacterium]